VYRRFGEVDAAGKSPLYERIAVALSESGEALRAIEAATAPPLLLQGDAVEVLPGAIARVPADALPVVITTWALSQFPLESRLRFLHRLDEAAARRAVAWVSAEGVGVALAIPTLGDRRASGHSIIGLAVSGGPALRAEAIGRCWSQAAFWRGWQTLPAPLERLPASGLYSDKTNVFLRAC
jgi:hypothetical protein